MDDEIYKGLLSVSKSGKKWQKKWAVLHRGPPYGDTRLEIFDSKENYEKKSNKKSVINLENCSSVKPEINNDGKKKEFLLRVDFSDDRQKQQVFLMENSEDRDTWLHHLSSLVYGSNDTNGEDTFEVEIIVNELTQKQHLSGYYQLFITAEDIILEKNGDSVMVWPLHLLRKYGRDKQEFSLEAGRRCPSGPGRFCFKSDQYNAIFQKVEDNVKSLAIRGRVASTSSTSSLGHRMKNDGMKSSSPRTPIPTSSVYDDPIDFQPTKNNIDDTYSEPIGLSLHQGKGKPQKQPKPNKLGLSGPKKPPRKNDNEANTSSEYSQLNLPGVGIQDSEYDSINYNDSWNQQVDDENAYEVTDNHINRMQQNQMQDSVYDHVKR